MNQKLLIRDVTLRDGQQSLFATRMQQAQIERVLPIYKEAGFYALEVWGGAVPDSIMRFLNEDPWERLEKIKKEIGNISHLTALSRGRNLFGYNPYPEEVLKGSTGMQSSRVSPSCEFLMHSMIPVTSDQPSNM
jgi:oxaloacetate decarboxylase alpha subunit/pyruvate carboxylase subunit B